MSFKILVDHNTRLTKAMFNARATHMCTPHKEGHYMHVFTGRSLIEESCACSFTNVGKFL